MKKIIINLKNNTNKVLVAFSMFLLNLTNIASAQEDIGDPTKLNEALEKVVPDLTAYIRPISAVLIFISIVCIGLNIIIHRAKAEERTNYMMGLFSVAAGAFILGSVGMIYSFAIQFIN